MINDEIKEILDYLKDEKWEYYPSDMTPYKAFFMEERDKLLDYITNLQQENERLKTKTKEQSLLLIDYQDMEQKSEDYKSRCEKAVEYLKQTSGNYKNLRYEPIKVITLINILNGRSDE